jgi:hypothetical protein
MYTDRHYIERSNNVTHSQTPYCSVFLENLTGSVLSGLATEPLGNIPETGPMTNHQGLVEMVILRILKRVGTGCVLSSCVTFCLHRRAVGVGCAITDSQLVVS